MGIKMTFTMVVSFAVLFAVGEEEYLYFKSGWGGYGDVAARGYRCLPFIKHGKSSVDAVYSFRAEKGVPEWVAFVPRVRVNGRELPPFVCGMATGGYGDKCRAHAHRVSFTNACGRLFVQILPRKTLVDFTYYREREEAVRTVDVGFGSHTDSGYVFNPAVTGVPIHEYPVRETQGIRPGLASPPPWIFSYRREGRPGCWSVALEPSPGRLDFSGFWHQAEADGSICWRVSYPGLPPSKGAFKIPTMVFRFGDADFYAALSRHVADLEAEGKIRKSARTWPAWHNEPLACTWRFQKGTNRPNPKSLLGPKQEQADEEHTEAFMKMLDDAGIHFGTVLIDDFWGPRHGVWEADPARWKDMRAFVDRVHAKGRRVMLWVCTDGDGMPEEALNGSQWRLENPVFLKLIKEMAHRMLSSDPGCYNADGVKFDFTGSHPSSRDPSMKYHGVGYMLRRFEILSEALLAVKPEAILDYQCCNPYFRHTQTMLRLNDYFGTAVNGWEEMSLRAKIAKIVAPDVLIDTDHISTGQASYEGGYEFFRRCRELGVPSYYLYEGDLEDPELLKILQSTR